MTSAIPSVEWRHMRKLEPEERLSTPPKPLPTEVRVLLGMLVGGLGVFIMLLY